MEDPAVSCFFASAAGAWREASTTETLPEINTAAAADSKRRQVVMVKLLFLRVWDNEKDVMGARGDHNVLVCPNP